MSGQQHQKGDFCVYRASAPMALLRREWGGRAGGMPASPMRWGVPSFAVTPKSCYRLVRPGDTAAKCGGFIPDGGSHPSSGHGAA